MTTALAIRFHAQTKRLPPSATTLKRVDQVLEVLHELVEHAARALEVARGVVAEHHEHIVQRPRVHVLWTRLLQLQLVVVELADDQQTVADAQRVGEREHGGGEAPVRWIHSL